MDENKRIKNRIKRARDFGKLWQKLRNEGYSVYEADDYTGNEQAPYHLYYIDKGHGAPVVVLYRDEINGDYKQEIEYIYY